MKRPQRGVEFTFAWVFDHVVQLQKRNFSIEKSIPRSNQQAVRRLSNQVSSFSIQTHESFLTCMQLTFMLHYRIHVFLRMEFSR